MSKESWTLAELRQALEKAGRRFTKQRAAVFRYLHAVESHPTAEQVFAAVRRSLPHISLATVYKALDSLVADETQERLKQAMTRVSPMQRDVFALRIAEGLSYRDIAQAVGTTEGAARVHYHNAMRAVKEFLDE